MSKGISRLTIPNAVLTGMKKAAKKWQQMHGTWANKAPEYWFSVNVSLELLKLLPEEKCWIGLEVGVREVLNLSRPRSPGPNKKAIREKGKIDIIVARVNEKPFAAIELKTCVHDFHKIKADVHRLRDLMLSKTKNSLSIACLVIYTDKSDTYSQKGAHVALEKIFELLLVGAKFECQESNLIIKSSTYIKKEDESGDCWGVQCITLARS